MNIEGRGLIQALGFLPKENASAVFVKKYADGYLIEADFEKERFNYGDKIKTDSKSTQNFSSTENFVVLECVNRLLEKGYKPEHIVLEKTWGAGHGTSGRLDICVTRDDGSEYLLIECKTYGKEFNKEFARMKKDGGQLFTYFKFSNKADVIMLYASELKGKEFIYRNEIVKIEDDYRTGDVKDFYEKWNKLTKDNGIFEAWVKPYNFQTKAITKEQLKEIRYEDSSFIFNRFLEILRHNVVSDKGNAFNKIFTLFLCKVYDETTTLDGEELQFQWIEGVDNHVDFQLRLIDLYSKGMQKFLERTVSDFNEEAFNNQCKNLTPETKDFLLKEVNKLRLEKNNEFAIKEVYDTPSFEENAKVVKEVVELIQGYKIRYNKRQQYLSDFFERLLTTGLKQEAGQFFTPVPIAQFIIKCLPIDTIVSEKLKQKDGEILPYMIDYAAGSGHFVTEYMHEVQNLINQDTHKKYIDSTANKIKNWQDDHFDWATKYVYGVEKDYRLVKVGKVGCYLHGDGLANVILSDGLANFSQCKDYRDKLKKDAKDTTKENQQFDILLSNPPYSVSAFRQTTREYYTENDFELYDYLTDNSSEIECLFVERTKQLLKDGGVAGIILPSSILSNEGIYTKTREIILKYFEIVAITELGSNTFMATGTNTVVLFLRRRNNYDTINLRESVERFFTNFQDVALNGIEKPFSKYVNHVWEGLSWEDYLSLLKNNPYDFIEKESELYKEYRRKLNVRTEKEFWQKFIETEKEKLLYFILAYPQKVVLVKTGEKDAEKRFLGYEFSNRRGSEGIHPIQRGKTIDECTKLFDDERFDNEEKASTYIYKAFANDYEFPIHESLKDNIYRIDLVDTLSFDRAFFDKSVNTNAQRKIKFDSKYGTVILDYLVTFQSGLWKGEKGDLQTVKVLRNTNFKFNNGKLSYDDVAEIEVEIKQLENRKLEYGDIILEKSGGSDTQAIGRVVLFDKKDNKIYSFSNFCTRIRVKDENIINPIYLWTILNDFYNKGGTIPLQNGVRLLNIDFTGYSKIKIPLPPKEIQEKIVAEIEVLEKEEGEAKEKVKKLKSEISTIFNVDTPNNCEILKLGDVCKIKAGEFVKVGDISNENQNGLYPCYGGNGLRGYTKTYTHEGLYSLVGRQGALCGNVHLVSGKFHATEHALVVTPKLNINTIWLYHKLVSMNLNQYATGTAQPGLSVINLVPIQIPLPPLSEQQKIVSEIEKIEAQIASLDQLLSELPKQKEAVLAKHL